MENQLITTQEVIQLVQISLLNAMTSIDEKLEENNKKIGERLEKASKPKKENKLREKKVK
jgi:hypothetical protein